MNNVYKTTEERETKPAISVITPVYNSEKYLEETLDSILNQTFSNLEIICIDDGSSDNSLAILRKYQKQDNRIKVMTQQHLGVVAARNNAIQEAQGEFIYLLDSDDVVDKTVLEKSYDAIIADKGDVITCRVRAFGLLDGEIYYWSPTKINMALCNCLPNAALFRKSLFEQSGGFDSAFRKGIEDYDFYLNLMYRQKARFYRIPEILFFYRIKSANESRDKQVVGAVKKELWDTLYKKYPEMRIYRNLFKLKKAVTCLLRNIFSVCNERKNGIKRKVITVLGVKLKVRVDDVRRQIMNTEIVSNKIVFNNFNGKGLRRQIMNTEIVSNKIVFNNFNGKGYGCNPKYIAEEIIRQKLPYELVWLVKNKERFKEEFPKEIKLVEYTIDNAIREFASAKVWISNVRMSPLYENGLIKKKGQFYIQTWHGSLGIKKIESAMKPSKLDHYVEYAKTDSKCIDCVLSNSLYDDSMFGRDFWYDGVVVRTGHPRCDMFFSSDSEKRKISGKVKEALSIDNNKKVLLYCPSFRDDYSLNAYDIDVAKTLDAVKRKFGKEWVFVVRLHPNLSNEAQNIFRYNKEIINATWYPDTLDLLLTSDIAISDYSSCIFDFIFTRKPAFIYASDLHEYSEDRGFYYPLEEAPFSIAENNKQLIDNILNFDDNMHSLKVDNFLKKQNCNEDGHSSERVVDLIKIIMEDK